MSLQDILENKVTASMVLLGVGRKVLFSVFVLQAQCYGEEETEETGRGEEEMVSPI